MEIGVENMLGKTFMLVVTGCPHFVSDILISLQ